MTGDRTGAPPTAAVHQDWAKAALPWQFEGWSDGYDRLRVRWIETQAPAAPAQHSYRWPADWERYQSDHC